jgi:hypothetical protein
MGKIIFVSAKIQKKNEKSISNAIGEYEIGEAIGEWKFYDESRKLRKIKYLDG